MFFIALTGLTLMTQSLDHAADGSVAQAGYLIPSLSHRSMA
jgi:hypothetical protein